MWRGAIRAARQFANPIESRRLKWGNLPAAAANLATKLALWREDAGLAEENQPKFEVRAAKHVTFLQLKKSECAKMAETRPVCCAGPI
jgi:hypothetical protein